MFLKLSVYSSLLGLARQGLNTCVKGFVELLGPLVWEIPRTDLALQFLQPILHLCSLKAVESNAPSINQHFISSLS